MCLYRNEGNNDGKRARCLISFNVIFMNLIALAVKLRNNAIIAVLKEACYLFS